MRHSNLLPFDKKNGGELSSCQTDSPVSCSGLKKSLAAGTPGGNTAGGNGLQAGSADRAGGRRQGREDDAVQQAGPGAAAERPPGGAHEIPR